MYYFEWVTQYVGKNTQYEAHPGMGLTGSIVMELMKTYHDKGHILYIDNWYTSPTLFKTLLEKKTEAVGTVCKNRKSLP